MSDAYHTTANTLMRYGLLGLLVLGGLLGGYLLRASVEPACPLSAALYMPLPTPGEPTYSFYVKEKAGDLWTLFNPFGAPWKGVSAHMCRRMEYEGPAYFDVAEWKCVRDDMLKSSRR